MGEEKATRQKDLWKKIRKIRGSALSCAGSSPPAARRLHGENPHRGWGCPTPRGCAGAAAGTSPLILGKIASQKHRHAALQGLRTLLRPRPCVVWRGRSLWDTGIGAAVNEGARPVLTDGRWLHHLHRVISLSLRLLRHFSSDSLQYEPEPRPPFPLICAKLS